MNRAYNIHNSLTALKESGHVADYYVRGDNGRRWVVWGRGWERVFSTAEVEAFIVGAKAVLFHEPPAQ